MRAVTGILAKSYTGLKEASKMTKTIKTLGVGVLVVAMLMEAFDLRDDFASFGHFRWNASLHDILNTVFWPAVVVVLFKFRLIK